MGVVACWTRYHLDRVSYRPVERERRESDKVGVRNLRWELHISKCSLRPLDEVVASKRRRVRERQRMKLFWMGGEA